MRAGYGEKLRTLLSNQLSIHQLVDFGDAPVFDASAYPSIILASKRNVETNQISILNWQLENKLDEFPAVFESKSSHIYQRGLSSDGWRLESSGVIKLLNRLSSTFTRLDEVAKGKFYRGIVTGLNEAFVIDSQKRDELINSDAKSSKLIKPFLRGRDAKRW